MRDQAQEVGVVLGKLGYVKVGAFYYKLILQDVEEDLETDNLGCHCSTSMTITINTNIHPLKAVEVLIHECLHAVWEQRVDEVADKKEEEAIVTAFGVGLATLFVDNPKFLTTIQDLWRLANDYAEDAEDIDVDGGYEGTTEPDIPELAHMVRRTMEELSRLSTEDQDRVIEAGGWGHLLEGAREWSSDRKERERQRASAESDERRSSPLPTSVDEVEGELQSPIRSTRHPARGNDEAE